MTFEKIYVEVEGKPVVPTWTAMIGQNACNSAAHVLDPAQISFTWSTTGSLGAVANRTDCKGFRC
jgi:hypothetical protein